MADRAFGLAEGVGNRMKKRTVVHVGVGNANCPRESPPLVIARMLAMFIPDNRKARAAFCVTVLFSALIPTTHAQAPASADWRQFRGPGALGRSDATGVPTTWSDDQNVVWKVALPGPGASSPITLGNRIFTTCFTGYKTSSSEPGEMKIGRAH